MYLPMCHLSISIPVYSVYYRSVSYRKLLIAEDWLIAEDCMLQTLLYVADTIFSRAELERPQFSGVLKIDCCVPFLGSFPQFQAPLFRQK
jgi:hypothetical protein